MASTDALPLLAGEQSNSSSSNKPQPSPPPAPAAAPPPRRNNPVMFRCNGYGDCAMVFTRSEHLARHVRKHTGDKPFTCHCGRNFSRLDNVRQHATTVHAEDAVANQEMMTRLMQLHNSLSAKTIQMQIEMGMVVKDGEIPKKVNTPGVGPNGGKTAKSKGTKAKGKKKKDGEEEDEEQNDGRGQFSVQRKRNDGVKMAMAHQQQQAIYYAQPYAADPQASPHYQHALPPPPPHYPPYSSTPPPGSASIHSQQAPQQGGSPSPRRRQPPPPPLLPGQARYGYQPQMGYSASPPYSHQQLQQQQQHGPPQQPPTPPGGPLTPGGTTQRGVTLPSISQLLPTRFNGQQPQQQGEDPNSPVYYAQDGSQVAQQPQQQQGMRGPPSGGSGHGRNGSFGTGFLPPGGGGGGYGGEMQHQQQLAMQQQQQQHDQHQHQQQQPYYPPPPTAYEQMYGRQGGDSEHSYADPSHSYPPPHHPQHHAYPPQYQHAPSPMVYGKPTYQLPSPALSHNQHVPSLPPLPPLPALPDERHQKREREEDNGGRGSGEWKRERI